MTKQDLLDRGFTVNPVGDYERETANGRAFLNVGNFPFNEPHIMLMVGEMTITMGEGLSLETVDAAIKLFDNSLVDSATGAYD